MIEPQTMPLDSMEQLLGQVYGGINLQRCRNRRGETQIVMLREDEPCGL